MFTWEEAGVTRGVFPVPGDAVILFDGADVQMGMIYAVHYGQQTLTVARNHTR